jgi:hypothetical protein
VLYGGAITDNKTNGGGGGAVGISVSSTFTMNGGIISNNTAFVGGAVAGNSGAQFIMNGGTIAHNTGTSGGGALQLVGVDTNFTMTGGTIANNTANVLAGGGVNIGAGTFTMSGGAITGNKAVTNAGGVHIFTNGTFIMTGGTITGNIAGMVGGGVCINTGTTTMRDGTIAGNTAGSGGGVGVVAGTFKKEPTSLGGSSGIIYGSNGGDNSNTATLAANTLKNEGHAVYITAGPKTRETPLVRRITWTAAHPAAGQSRGKRSEELGERS